MRSFLERNLSRGVVRAHFNICIKLGESELNLLDNLIFFFPFSL